MESNNEDWKPTAVDLFSGSGAITSALKAANYLIAAAVDNDPVACETFRYNHPDVNLYEADILKLDPREILKYDLGGKYLDLLVVCAPCQPFSSQNKKREAGDARSELILQAERFARILNPKVIFFENVAGFTTKMFEPVYLSLKSNLEKAGYKLNAPQRIDAADFGVPQRRVRCIMTAFRSGCKGELDFTNIKMRRRTVREVISHLPSLKPGEICKDDILHRSRRHSELTLRRLSYIPADGGGRNSLPEELQLNCHKGFKGHPDVYGRMKWDDVAPTLTTGCTDLTKGRFVHPAENRAVSLREAALLQTFPSDYRFFGNLTQISRQIGNAVPINMAKQMFSVVREVIEKR